MQIYYYDIDTDISNSLDFTYSSFILSLIGSPAHTTSVLATLTNDIFTNNCNSSYTSSWHLDVNLVIPLSDHAQFLIKENQPNLFENNKEDQLFCDFQETKNKQIYNI